MENVKNVKSYIKKAPQYFLIIATLLSVFGVFYYTIGLSKNFVNTDIFDTLLWAKASYESGKIISPDFYYSAFLPFGGSLLMLPFIPFFGVSFTTHVIGMVIFEIIFLVCFVLFFRKIGFNANWIMIALIANCLLWLCSDKFREMFMEHIIYYSLSALFVLVGYMLINEFICSINSASKRKKIILGLISFTFFTFVATDGVQIIGLATVPVIAAFICERFFDVKTRITSKENRPTIVAVVIVGIATVAGLIVIKMLLNGSVSEYASSFSQYDTNDRIYMYPQKIKNFIDCWYQLFEVFFISKVSLSSINQIPILVTAAYATILLLTVPITALFYKKLKAQEVKKLFWIALFVNAITLFLWIVGTIAGVEWRLIPSVFASFLLLITELKMMFETVELKRFSIVIIAVVLLTAYPSFNYLIAYSPTDSYAGYSSLLEKMEYNNITHGYGNYWISGTLNVLTREKVNIEFVEFHTDEKLHIYQYQQFPHIDDNTSDNTILILQTKATDFYEQTDLYKNNKERLLEKYEMGGEFGYVAYFYDYDIYGSIVNP